MAAEGDDIPGTEFFPPLAAYRTIYKSFSGLYGVFRFPPGSYKPRKFDKILEFDIFSCYFYSIHTIFSSLIVFQTYRQDHI